MDKTYQIGTKRYTLSEKMIEDIKKEVPDSTNLAIAAAKLMEANVVKQFDVIGALLLALRIYEPNSRAFDLYRYVKNGSSVRRRDRIDGLHGITWCGRYPRTVSSLKDEEEGTQKLIDEVLAYYGAWSDVKNAKA